LALPKRPTSYTWYLFMANTPPYFAKHMCSCGEMIGHHRVHGVEAEMRSTSCHVKRCCAFPLQLHVHGGDPLVCGPQPVRQLGSDVVGADPGSHGLHWSCRPSASTSRGAAKGTPCSRRLRSKNLPGLNSPRLASSPAGRTGSRHASAAKRSTLQCSALKRPSSASFGAR
jgi:hypothetical protein